MFTVIYTILIFGVIIFIHEFGHFIVARLTHVTVNEFSLGMGPALIKHQGKKTLYSFRAFPIGGYCAMAGEDAAGSGNVKLNEKENASSDDTSSDEDDPNAFNKKSVSARVAISAAGAFMNIVLGFFIILLVVSFQKYYLAPIVGGIRDNAPAGVNVLQKGDKIVKMNGTAIIDANDIPFEMQRDSDGIIDIQVKREGKLIDLPQVDFTITDKDGKKFLTSGFYVSKIMPSFWGAFDHAGRQTFSLARNSWLSIGDLITGKIGIMELSGPVGVGKVVGEAAKIGWTTLFELAAFISISIGIFNLLPFPALDGGRIVFLVIEAIRRKSINPKWEGYINAAGLVLLFLLMIVVTLKDIWNLF